MQIETHPLQVYLSRFACFALLLLAEVVIAGESKAPKRAEPAGYRVEAHCKTNKSTYFIGEPIYLDISIRVFADSLPLTDRFFGNDGGFVYTVIPAGAKWEWAFGNFSHEQHMPRGKKVYLKASDQISTRLEVVYNEDFGGRVPRVLLPGVRDDELAKHLETPEDFPAEWSRLFHYNEGEYQINISITCLETTEDRFVLRASSNRFRVTPTPEVQPSFFAKYALLGRVKNLDKIEKAEKQLLDGNIPTWFRAAYMHTIMRRYRDIGKWEKTLRYGNQLVRDYPGYPLLAEVEFDMALALLALGEKEKREGMKEGAARRMWYLLDRVGLSRMVHPVYRLPSDNPPPEVLAANKLYDEIAAKIKNGERADSQTKPTHPQPEELQESEAEKEPAPAVAPEEGVATESQAANDKENDKEDD